MLDAPAVMPSVPQSETSDEQLLVHTSVHHSGVQPSPCPGEGFRETTTTVEVSVGDCRFVTAITTSVTRPLGSHSIEMTTTVRIGNDDSPESDVEEAASDPDGAARQPTDESTIGESPAPDMRQGGPLSRPTPAARQWPSDIQACQLHSLRVEDALSGHGELIDGFNMFLPNGYKINVAAMSESLDQQESAEAPPSIAFPPEHQLHDVLPEDATAGETPPTNDAQLEKPSELNTDDSTNGSPPLEEHAEAPATEEKTEEHASGNSQSDANSLLLHSEKMTEERRRAVALINKIRNHFKDEPEKYATFLKFVQDFVKKKRNDKDPSEGTLNEMQLYEQVAQLLGKEDGILEEFSRFLSLKDNCSPMTRACRKRKSSMTPLPAKRVKSEDDESIDLSPQEQAKKPRNKAKLLHPRDDDSPQESAPAKRAKTVSLRDVSLAEASKYGSMSDHAFFDNVKRALKSQLVYENFLRCLMLFNQEVVTRKELVQLVTPFLGKFPELFRWFKKVLNYPERSRSRHLFPIFDEVMSRKRCHGDFSADMGNALCSRVGVSYCALPRKYEHPKCSGRTALCREVLNDAWVSFPSWSEGSTFVTLRKSSFEEFLHQCEDERFELDLVLELNAATIRVLEAVIKKMTRMTPKETARFKLTDCLGGSSPTIHQRAIRQIYGDKAGDIIDGLKKKPLVAVPVVLRRLKAKEEEWRTAQKEFNKVWREQNEKYYLKSLDHQASGFKQNDLKALRSKHLLNEIESLQEERREQMEEARVLLTGPHLMLPYRNTNVVDDAADLVMHYVADQAGLVEAEKQKIASLLRGLVKCFFSCETLDASSRAVFCEELGAGSKSEKSEEKVAVDEKAKETQSPRKESKPLVEHHRFIRFVSQRPAIKSPWRFQTGEERYTMFYGNNNWYLFFRLHQTLCERLASIQDTAVHNVVEQAKLSNAKESASTALRLKPTKELLHDVEIKDYYPTFLKLVKKLMVGAIDNAVYEDTLREMFGIHAYVAFTLDKVVSHAARQLVHLVSDENCRKCSQLFLEMLGAEATGGLCTDAHRRYAAEMNYQKQAKHVFRGGNCFKMVVYQKTCNLTIELLEPEKDDGFPPDVQRWQTYVDTYSNEREPFTVLSLNFPPTNNAVALKDNVLVHTLASKVRDSHSFVFLPRNMRSWWIRYGQPDVNVTPEVKFNCKPTPDSDRKRSARLRSAGNSGLYRNSGAETAGDTSTLLASDSTQCRILFKQYRIMFISNKDQFMYRRHAFRRARVSHAALSRRLDARFHSWLAVWVRRHVSKAQQNACLRWLMGQNGGGGGTAACADNDVVRPPYRTYTRYRVT